MTNHEMKNKPAEAAMPGPDLRNIGNGRRIATSGYCDQPYIVKNDDGSWTCVMTTGSDHEGQIGQHIVAMRTTDQGRIWSASVAIESPDGPEASWGMPLKVPGGRIYVFYVYNSLNLREVIADDDAGHYRNRVDSLGDYVFKYSDDDGRTWSERRYVIPVRKMRIDRENPYGGQVLFFWGVGKPIVSGDAVYFGFAKIGRFGNGFMAVDESCFMRSDNILSEPDPERVRWETLPDGDEGLRAPKGPIADEAYPVALSDGSLYCTYRTIDGHPCHAYSRDGGHTWSGPGYMTFADGRRVKHPRAANFVWRLGSGKYLYWFHNHGGTWYEERNPVWVSGGVERDGRDGKEIDWSEPEVLLYDDDPRTRMSYPDLIEDGGAVYITETEKVVARVHQIDQGLLEGLWAQSECAEVTTAGLVMSLPEPGDVMAAEVKMPEMPHFSRRRLDATGDRARPGHGSEDLRQGFSLDMWLRMDSIGPGQVVLDSRNESGQGLALETTDRGTIAIVMNDDGTENRWDCDPGVLQRGKEHHLAVIVDGGPKIISFVVDGRLCDGGGYRQFGWGRFSPNLRHVNGAGTLRIGPSLRGEIRTLRIYNRYLRTSEAVANFRAGQP